MIENVVFTSDDEGNKYYIPVDKLEDWGNLFDYGRDGEEVDIPDWANPVEGELYVVDIKRKV